ncbi:hypothetical protein AQI70_31640 [Streptomyces curacoi]|uniref:Uncharacterized protein n=1 Tax=Streptomyces curacoi TaxID=146536 RepID=A0A117NXP3_9ACTN|nr:hypothetical protein AQI70_31640 [Streptomyces curacoi]
MSGATTQRAPPGVARVPSGPAEDVRSAEGVGAGTVTASPVPWHRSGGMPSVRPTSSQRRREGSRWAVPGAANISIRPRKTATGPEPGPSSHSRSSIRRPKSAGALTMSNTEPQGRTTGASGRSAQRASMLRGYVPAEASHAAPSAVTPETAVVASAASKGPEMSSSRVLLMSHRSTGCE